MHKSGIQDLINNASLTASCFESRLHNSSLKDNTEWTVFAFQNVLCYWRTWILFFLAIRNTSHNCIYQPIQNVFRPPLWKPFVRPADVCHCNCMWTGKQHMNENSWRVDLQDLPSSPSECTVKVEFGQLGKCDLGPIWVCDVFCSESGRPYEPIDGRPISLELQILDHPWLSMLWIFPANRCILASP